MKVFRRAPTPIKMSTTLGAELYSKVPDTYQIIFIVVCTLLAIAIIYAIIKAIVDRACDCMCCVLKSPFKACYYVCCTGGGRAADDDGL